MHVESRADQSPESLGCHQHDHDGNQPEQNQIGGATIRERLTLGEENQHANDRPFSSADATDHEAVQ